MPHVRVYMVLIMEWSEEGEEDDVGGAAHCRSARACSECIVHLPRLKQAACASNLANCIYQTKKYLQFEANNSKISAT